MFKILTDIHLNVRRYTKYTNVVIHTNSIILKVQKCPNKTDVHVNLNFGFWDPTIFRRVCVLSTCSKSIQNGPGWSQDHPKPSNKFRNDLFHTFCICLLYMCLLLLPIGLPIELLITRWLCRHCQATWRQMALMWKITRID